MSTLINKYGTYTIKPGTLLYRRAETQDFYDTMFFGFCTTGASTSNSHSTHVQVWKTTKVIRSLLLLRGQELSAEEPKLLSAIVDIYNEQFPDDQQHEYADLYLKQTDHEKRRAIIRLLQSQGIYSWVCSVEDNHIMELFLFSTTQRHEEFFSRIDSYEDVPCVPKKAYPNTFDYSQVSHLPLMKKGPRPPNPTGDSIFLGDLALGLTPGD